MDDDFASWNAFGSKYWPSTYLVDSTGRLRYSHFGEGRYRSTEAAIRRLIAEAGESPSPAPASEPARRSRSSPSRKQTASERIVMAGLSPMR